MGIIVQWPLYTIIDLLCLLHVSGVFRDVIFYCIEAALFVFMYKKNPYLAIGFIATAMPTSIYTAKQFVTFARGLGGPG
jgi:hypothetical protein